MKYRKLRIAWSVAWGVVALLLCVLWVRSYWWVESASFLSINGSTIEFGSIKGAFILGAIQGRKPWKTDHLPVAEWERFLTENGPIPPFPSNVWGGIYKTPNGSSIFLPYWLLTSAFAVLCATPWLGYIPRRFSLRTLLIATTLVAVVLGLIVYVSQ